MGRRKTVVGSQDKPGLISEDIDNFSLKMRKMFGFPIFSRGAGVLLKEIEKQTKKEKRWWIATVNPEFAVVARSDVKFRKILNTTKYNVPDGVGITWAMSLLEKKRWGLKEAWRAGVEVWTGGHREWLIPGVELMDRLCQIAERRGKTVYFLGGFGKRAEKTAGYFGMRHPRLRVKYSPGSPEVSNEEVIEDINQSKVDFLFVAYGMQKQEEWIEENLSKLEVGLVMGVGRSFDYFSGELTRAPESWRSRGLEWLYSLLRQPKRWKRQLRLLDFIWLVLKNRPRI